MYLSVLERITMCSSFRRDKNVLKIATISAKEIYWLLWFLTMRPYCNNSIANIVFIRPMNYKYFSNIVFTFEIFAVKYCYYRNSSFMFETLATKLHNSSCKNFTVIDKL